MTGGNVKAVSGISVRKKNSKTAENGKKKQWGIRFLECLLEEIEEQETAKEQGKARAESGRGKSCEITVKTMEETVTCSPDRPLRMKRDTLELSVENTDGLLTSELYTDIIDAVRCVGKWKADLLYKVADRIMKGYYDGRFQEREVEELFWCCYYRGTEGAYTTTDGKMEIRDKISEYFCRVNARKCVMENEREGRFLVEGSGLTWAGTTYYNSDYYYEWKRIRMLIMRINMEISAKEKLPYVSFDQIEQQSEFCGVGGLTYQGVFVWIQRKDNDPPGQYGMRNMEKMPPERFRYLYRNHFTVEEQLGVELLERRMRQQRRDEKEGIWRKFTLQDGQDYHNGMSYLLEGSLMHESEEAVYGDAMGFLQNFRLYRVRGCAEFLAV